MSLELIADRLSSENITKLRSLKKRSEDLLGNSPRFKFFTLHGKAHLDSLFKILKIFITSGFSLNEDELVILAASICVHDLGMVIKLQDKDLTYLLDGRAQSSDPALLENLIRDTHHELIDSYLQQDLFFLTGLGFTPSEISDIRIVSKCHRKLDLHSQHGRIKKLGALLRIIDELDLSAARAPFSVFLNLVNEMDSTATWHWFKHNIVCEWEKSVTVYERSINNKKELIFDLIVRPSRKESIKYWLTQISRPINKALHDDGVRKILRAEWSISVDLKTNSENSCVNDLGEVWNGLEEKSLAESTNVILIVDDEFRKIEASFIPLMDDYTVVSAPTAKAALEQLKARRIDFVIVDLQIGSGGIWDEEETVDYKFTGLRLIQEIRELELSPGIGILSGSKHNLEVLDNIQTDFFIRKPGDPDEIKQSIDNFFRK